jgi:predicted O-linked N-acetylglucosamine transferase (SPINDLY family)
MKLKYGRKEIRFGRPGAAGQVLPRELHSFPAGGMRGAVDDMAAVGARRPKPCSRMVELPGAKGMKAPPGEWSEAVVDAGPQVLDEEGDRNIRAALAALSRGQFREAAVLAGEVAQRIPDFSFSWQIIGTALAHLGRPADALHCLHKAVSLSPGDADAHGNLAGTLQNLGRTAEAVPSFRTAIEIRPGDAVLHNKLGNALSLLGRFDEAESCQRRALELDPGFFKAHSDLIFCMNYMQRDPLLCLDEARSFGRNVATRAGTRLATGITEKKPDRLRVGLVSGDLCQHPVGHFIESVLENLDPARVELVAYPSFFIADELTARIMPRFAAWKPIMGMSDEAAARMIHADGVHILVDLSGHTAYNRLPMFAWKPAPVQASWLGYFATTGVEEIDYFIADQLSLPPSLEPQFTETVLCLPETRLCFTVPKPEIAVSPLPALSNGFVTFASFNNFSKINDSVVALWARLLRELPSSCILFKSGQIREPSVLQLMIERFAAHGIAGDRLTLEGPSPRADYLAAYQRVDIALDPFPYTGGATTTESLWMGVPVVTLAGERLVGRQGVALLTLAGLSDWIAQDADGYVDLVAKKTRDLAALGNLRSNLRGQVEACALFNAGRFARHFGEALYWMWERSQPAFG